MKKIKLFGRVQGVGLRYLVQRYATNLGLFGTVQNKYDGSVEIIVGGKHIKKLVTWLKTNPGMSHIEKIQEYQIPEEKVTSFSILR